MAKAMTSHQPFEEWITVFGSERLTGGPCSKTFLDFKNGIDSMAPLRLLSARCITLACLCWLTLAPALAFDFGDVAERARELAATPFKKPIDNLPRELQNLSYDQYRDIRFKPDKAYWSSARLPFELMFFHQGFYYQERVRINEVTRQGAREIKFSPEFFDYGANRLDPAKMQELGFAGFRVHYPINTPKYKDEVLAFLGASYFRALGKGQGYGQSARGLAIDTALISGEEFPQFVEFWIERPGPTAKELKIYGLLDSRRAAGAYQFVLRPGPETSLEIKARLYLREQIGKLGLAPLTTMYFFGENQRPTRDDYRPEVHDSDGLSIHSGTGEWIWRPLVNPKRLLVTSFALTDPLGFGVMQRDRDFMHYEDLEARYELRPSVWVEPKGSWGPGRVELIQLPTPDETNDNVVAYWVPDKPPQVKEPYDFEYRLSWQKNPETRSALSWVAQTRRGGRSTHSAEQSIGYVIDFEGPALKKLPADATLEGVVSIDSNAKLLEHTVYRNEVTGGWRLALRLRRLDESKPAELRGYLRSGNEALSETWSYILPPN
jgi:glucans biosynthesis protein